MTTIAWDGDGRTLAADCQSTCGNARFKVSKLRMFMPEREERWRMLAYAGDADMGEQMIAWFERGASPSDFPEHQRDPARFATLVVVGKKSLEVYECTPYPIRHPVRDLFATGSGAPYALAAMHLGKTAAQAVEVAAVFDVKTGMGVETLELPP